MFRCDFQHGYFESVGRFRDATFMSYGCFRQFLSNIQSNVRTPIKARFPPLFLIYFENREGGIMRSTRHFKGNRPIFLHSSKRKKDPVYYM